MDALHDAGPTGWNPVRAQVRWGRRVKQLPDPLPELYVLHVTGVAWRVGVDRERIRVCADCGRFKPVVGLVAVDEARRDGSDSFHADLNPNIVPVTDRVCTVLTEHGFTNSACAARKFCPCLASILDGNVPPRPPAIPTSLGENGRRTQQNGRRTQQDA